ncbi:MAG: ABC transporter permease [Atribacterota bacterium]|nr:ABC transporter permease [Atribacterota bacterium]
MMSGRNTFRRFFRRIVQSPTGLIGMIILFIWVLVAILASLLAPYKSTTMHLTEKLMPPSSNFWLGTDTFGRDVLSRIIYGSRTILTISLSTAIISTFCGVIIGFFSGYFGKIIDKVIMKFLDILISIPALVLALVMLGLMDKPGVGTIIIIISIVYVPWTARVARSRLLEWKSLEFVDAARIRGESHFYIMFSEILPNTINSILVEGTARFSYAIMTVASLGFLGVGIQPPSPDWGMMVAESKTVLIVAPWTVLFPSIAIGTLVIGSSFFTEFLCEFFLKE